MWGYRLVEVIEVKLILCLVSTGQVAAEFPFVVCKSLQAMPHLTSIRVGVEGFNLCPLLMLCLFDGSSEGIVGFLIIIRVSVPNLESGSSCL